MTWGTVATGNHRDLSFCHRYWSSSPYIPIHLSRHTLLSPSLPLLSYKHVAILFDRLTLLPPLSQQLPISQVTSFSFTTLRQPTTGGSTGHGVRGR